jgi:hypothetical protein
MTCVGAADRLRKSGAAQAGAAAASATTETGQAAGSGRFSGRFGLSLSLGSAALIGRVGGSSVTVPRRLDDNRMPRGRGGICC